MRGRRRSRGDQPGNWRQETALLVEGSFLSGNPTPAPLTGLTPPVATPALAGPPTAKIRHGFIGWPAGVAARKGSDALTAGRPGSREASLAGQLVKGTVGYADQH